MRRFVVFAQIISVSLFVFGCGGTDEQNNKKIEDLASSQCTVVESPDGEQSVIRCTDGSMAIIKNGRTGFKGEDGKPGEAGKDGEIGEKGAPGESCAVTDNQDGSHTITCPDGEVTINDGKDGGSCSIVPENGTNMLKCDDGTSLDLGTGGGTTTMCTTLKGNLTIENQLDLDAFAEAGCTSVSGDLRISVADVSDISALKTLTLVGGSLVISNNSALSTLSGLENITEVGGVLIVDDNDALTTLAALSNVGSVTAESVSLLQVTHNPSLITLQGLENIAQVGRLDVSNNITMTSLDGLSGVTQISEELHLKGNLLLNSVQALSNATGDMDAIILKDNRVLSSLVGLGGFGQIGSLVIENNGGLVTLMGLSPERVLDSIIVRNNDALTSLQGLESMNYSNPNLVSFGSFYIEDNDVLVSIAALGVIAQMTGDMVIRHNKSLTTFWADFVGPIEVRDVIVEGNESLLVIPDFTTLAVARNVHLLNNAKITEVGFSSLYEVNILEIRGNDSLNAPMGILNLFESNTIIIEDNNALTSLSWMPAFFAIRERLRVVNNIGLDPCLIDGLYNLQPQSEWPSIVQAWGNTGGMGFCP